MNKTKSDSIIDIFAALASGITLIFVLAMLFGAVGYLLYVLIRLIDVLIF